MKSRTITRAAYAIILPSVVAWSLYRTFTNIDMTRTRLFVTYWPEWIGMIALILVLMVVFPTRRL